MLKKLLTFCIIALASSTAIISAQTSHPGPRGDGKTILPNGWLISPAGKQVQVAGMPLNAIIDPTGQYAIVTNNGGGTQKISVIDLRASVVTQSLPIASAWLGLKFIDEGRRFLVSGGMDNRIFIFTFQNGTAERYDSIVLAPKWEEGKMWIGGIDCDDEAGVVYATGKYDSSLYCISLNSKKVLRRVRLGGIPYTCLLSKSRDLVFISMWGKSQIDLIDTKSMSLSDSIRVDDHPNEMLQSADGRRLWVACANRNIVQGIGLKTRAIVSSFSSAMYPGSLVGSTPNSLSLSADNKRLYVANADNNCVAVVDISSGDSCRVIGYVPTAWYPTCVRLAEGDSLLVVLNGKGAGSRANPNGPRPGRHTPEDQYTGSMQLGTVSLIPMPTSSVLGNYSAQVLDNASYKGNADSSVAAKASIFPAPFNGAQSPIKHVFYILKENRTYDQVFGDMKEGNGDSTLALFNEQVTPNHHALARQFVLMDNFYADAEVSADGHSWSMGAYVTDFVEKTLPTYYGGRGGDFDFDADNPTARPSGGYIWDDCLRNNVSYRDYGEFTFTPKNDEDTSKPYLPSLAGHIAPHYHGWDLDYSDIERVKAWRQEFADYVANGNLPQLETIHLPNDHTSGTAKGKRTPKAYVAQNDLALGMIVETISHSIYWKESAIFVVEDDAQNGPDHVDAHRTVALVISPYTKHHFVDSTHYSTVSMVRTLESILGLPPMSQFDAGATAMVNAFEWKLDSASYEHRPANIDIEERNKPGAYRQKESDRMDFSAPDLADDETLNEIIWGSIKGSALGMEHGKKDGKRQNDANGVKPMESTKKNDLER